MHNEKRYAVLISNYPSEEKPNALGFVHSRVRAYLSQGMLIDVYRINKTVYTYKFENVCVHCGTVEHIQKCFEEIEYEAILIHFLDKNKMRIVGNRKCVIWVHGFEALSWKRRLYNMNLRLPIYAIENTKQLCDFKKYAISNPQSKFIFVSDWMYNVTCSDIKFNIENYSIIHNYIDASIFQYTAKKSEDIKKLLLIRSFENKKYANDITVRFIRELSKKDFFNEIEITIYGAGKFFNKLTKKLKRFKNVSVHNHFLTQPEIAELQKQNGIFLCPTRQDAQGVSMCEAMSSGLVPLTSNNTAIPEFVSENKEGLLCNNRDIKSFVCAYEMLYRNPKQFLEMSKAASLRVQRQCSLNNTVMKEIEIIKQM